MPRPLITRRDFDAIAEEKRLKEAAEAERQAQLLEATRIREEEIRLAQEELEYAKAIQDTIEKADRIRAARIEAQNHEDAIKKRVQAGIKAQDTLAQNISKLLDTDIEIGRLSGMDRLKTLISKQYPLAHKAILFKKPSGYPFVTAYETMKLFAHAVDGKMIEGSYIRALTLRDDIYDFNHSSLVEELNLILGQYIHEYSGVLTLHESIEKLLAIETAHNTCKRNDVSSFYFETDTLSRTHTLCASKNNAYLLICMGVNSTLDVEFIEELSTHRNVIVCVAVDRG